MAFHLAPSLDRIGTATVLERGDPRMTKPHRRHIVGDSVYFVANSQQSDLDSANHIWPPNKLGKTVMWKMKLPGANR